MTNAHFNVLAEKLASENGFDVGHDDAIDEQLAGLRDKPASALAEAKDATDMRGLLWSSIDNRDSEDLDQIEYAEDTGNGITRLLIGIADVDSYVKRGTPIDQRAQKNTTTLYTGDVIFPMLPEELSTNLTSLQPDVDRLALVAELFLDGQGQIQRRSAYRALVRNHAKLAYSDIARFLDLNGEEKLEKEVDGLDKQLLLQRDIASNLHHLRVKQGSLNFETIEPVVVKSGDKVVDLKNNDHNSARDMIENMMIAANIAFAEILEESGIASLRRIVRTPKRWDRIVDIAKDKGTELPAEPDAKALQQFLVDQKAQAPDTFPELSLSIVKLLGAGEYVVARPGEVHEGHFSLAVHDYTHSTAPNRRFADLVTQRLLKAAINKQPSPYSDEDLEAIAKHCTEMSSASNRVERSMRKAIAAQLLSTRIGETFDGIVTGIKGDSTFVRIIHPSAEGRLMDAEKHVDVGDKIRVKLLSTNPDRGFVDFGLAD